MKDGKVIATLEQNCAEQLKAYVRYAYELSTAAKTIQQY